MIIEQLKQLGLSDNEAKTYSAMLELGPSPVIAIAQKAGVNRPTAYAQIENLQKMGLVSTQEQGKKTIYIAESPDHLQMMLEHKAEEIQEKKSALNHVMPQLVALFKASDTKPQVRFFEGKEGAKRVQDEFLKSTTKQSISLTSIDDVIGVFPNHPSKYTPRRVQLGIHSRLIYTSAKGPFLKNDQSLLRQVRFISAEKLPFHLDLLVYDDTVVMSDMKTQVSSILIKHQGIADSMRSLLEFIWSQAEVVE